MTADAGWTWTRWLPACAGLAAAAIALLQLFVPTTRGLADNGDFIRLLCHLGVEPVTGDEEQFFQYVYVENDSVDVPAVTDCDYRSTTEAVLRAAQVATAVSGGDGLDLRAVGVLYAAAFGAAVGALVAAFERGPGRVAVATGAVALLSDGSLVAYFTSAYSEPTAMVGVVAGAALLLGWLRSGRSALLVSFVVAAVVVVGAKSQYGPVALPLAAAVLVPPLHRSGRLGVAVWPRVVAAVLIVVGGVVTLTARPSYLGVANRWNAVFVELLPHAGDPKVAVGRLGLAEDALAFVGANYWSPGAGAESPAAASLIDDVDERDILGYYLAEPRQTADLLVRGVAAVGDPRVDYLGKTTPAEPPGSKDACRWCPVSLVGRALGSWSALPVVLTWAGVVALSIRGRRWRSTPAAQVALVCVGIAVLQLVVVVFGEGSWELNKHLSLATTATLLAGIIAAGTVATGTDRQDADSLPRESGEPDGEAQARSV